MMPIRAAEPTPTLGRFSSLALLLALISAAGAAGCALSPIAWSSNTVLQSTSAAPAMPDKTQVHEMHVELVRLLNVWLDKNRLAREDGHIFGVDIGQILVYAGLVGDRRLFDKVRPLVDPMVINRPEDPYTQGFVRWRYQKDEKADASGTAEALWMARGLWLGAKAFNRPADAKLALRMIDGYRRHEYTESGVWYVRNYFNFGLRAFATNSYTVNYMPDFLAEVASATKDAKLTELARQSNNLIVKAVSPGGMMNSMIQPEVTTIFPTLDLTSFAPNGIVSVFETCGVIETIVVSKPEVAEHFLDVIGRGGRSEFYMSEDGKPYGKAKLTPFPATCNLRLAISLNNKRVIDGEMPYFYEVARAWLADPIEPRLFSLGQFLLTMAAVERKPAE